MDALTQPRHDLENWPSFNARLGRKKNLFFQNPVISHCEFCRDTNFPDRNLEKKLQFIETLIENNQITSELNPFELNLTFDILNGKASLTTKTQSIPSFSEPMCLSSEYHAPSWNYSQTSQRNHHLESFVVPFHHILPVYLTATLIYIIYIMIVYSFLRRKIVKTQKTIKTMVEKELIDEMFQLEELYPDTIQINQINAQETNLNLLSEIETTTNPLLIPEKYLQTNACSFPVIEIDEQMIFKKRKKRKLSRSSSPLLELAMVYEHNCAQDEILPFEPSFPGYIFSIDKKQSTSSDPNTCFLHENPLSNKTKPRVSSSVSLLPKQNEYFDSNQSNILLEPQHSLSSLSDDYLEYFEYYCDKEEVEGDVEGEEGEEADDEAFSLSSASFSDISFTRNKDQINKQEEELESEEESEDEIKEVEGEESDVVFSHEEVEDEVESSYYLHSPLSPLVHQLNNLSPWDPITQSNQEHVINHLIRPTLSKDSFDSHDETQEITSRDIKASFLQKTLPDDSPVRQALPLLGTARPIIISPHFPRSFPTKPMSSSPDRKSQLLKTFVRNYPRQSVNVVSPLSQHSYTSPETRSNPPITSTINSVTPSTSFQTTGLLQIERSLFPTPTKPSKPIDLLSQKILPSPVSLSIAEQISQKIPLKELLQRRNEVYAKDKQPVVESQPIVEIISSTINCISSSTSSPSTSGDENHTCITSFTSATNFSTGTKTMFPSASSFVASSLTPNHTKVNITLESKESFKVRAETPPPHTPSRGFSQQSTPEKHRLREAFLRPSADVYQPIVGIFEILP